MLCLATAGLRLAIVCDTMEPPTAKTRKKETEECLGWNELARQKRRDDTEKQKRARGLKGLLQIQVCSAALNNYPIGFAIQANINIYGWHCLKCGDFELLYLQLFLFHGVIRHTQNIWLLTFFWHAYAML